VGIERPSSRDHVKTFNLDIRAARASKSFFAQFIPYNRSKLGDCSCLSAAVANGAVRKELGAIANESGVFVGPLDPHRDFLIFGHESSSRS
jgi:hypothetical protein